MPKIVLTPTTPSLTNITEYEPMTVTCAVESSTEVQETTQDICMAEVNIFD